MGSGHALESARRLKENIKLIKYRHSRFNEMRKAVSKIHSKYHEFNDKSTLNDEQLKSLKKKIKKRIILQKQKTILTSLMVTTIIVAILFLIGQYAFNYFIG